MTAGAEDLDLDHLRSWIGREEVAKDVVTIELVRKFNATLDLPSGALEIGHVAPRLIHFCLAQPASLTAELGNDGHPQRGGFLPPVPLPRRMWAGGHLSFQGELRIGDELRRTSRIVDVVAKSGSSGPLCFVTVQHTAHVGVKPVLSERQDIVYRGADGGGPAKTPGRAEPGKHQLRIDPSPPLLFRYSALTFNGHRIHYDRRYVTEVEQYPGLIVHGPLQATLLANFAAQLRGAPLVRFSFRGLSPLFDDEAFVLHAVEDGNEMKLWTARENGPVAMSAVAEWA